MADDLTLTDEEKQAILDARAKNKTPRKVIIHGEHEGTRYDFELEGDEAENVISRHKGLFAPPPADDKSTKPPRPTLIPPRKTGTG